MLKIRWRGVDDDNRPSMVTATVDAAEIERLGTVLVFRDDEGEALLLVPESSLIDAAFKEGSVSA